MIMQMHISSAAHRYDAIFVTNFVLFCVAIQSSRQRAYLRSTIKWIIIHCQSQCAKTPSQWQWMSQTFNGMISDLSQHGSLRHATGPQVTSANFSVKSWCFFLTLVTDYADNRNLWYFLMHIFTSRNVNWSTGVMWIACGLLCVMFLSAVWTLIPKAPIHFSPNSC